MRYIFLIIILCFSVKSFSQDYSSDLISPDLMKNASAVIRLEKTDFSIESLKKTVEKRKYAVTILNKKGDEYATFIEPYDRFSDITIVSAKIFDNKGKIIRLINKADFKDFSNYSDYTMFSDNRVIYHKPLINEYPYTIEYEWVIKKNTTVYFPNWKPQRFSDISVEKSIFTISVPQNLSFRYKEFNLADKVFITNNENKKIYKWFVENIPVYEDEPFSTNIFDYLPVVYTAPDDFEIENFSGNMESWENIGKWVSAVNSGRQNLNESTINELKKLVDGIIDPNEKVKKIYNFLQSKTRYVGVQIGIGGFQPVDAATVDKLGYGDCKALSNYTIAMLNAVGIKSYYTLVKAGLNKKIISDFPSLQFNHVIVCVPLNVDTIWLECTSQSNPFGYIGGFTDNRDALVITEDGGKIVHTKHYFLNENKKTCNALININEKGEGRAFIRIIYSGIPYNDIAEILNESKEQQKKLLYDFLNISNFDISNFVLEKINTQIPTAKESLILSLKQYASVSQNRLYLPLNLFINNKEIPVKLKMRKSEIYIPSSCFYSDTMIYVIPDSFNIEYTPLDVSLFKTFGNYSTSSTIKGDTITYIRTLIMNEGKYSQNLYNDFVQFYKDVDFADKGRMIFIKNN